MKVVNPSTNLTSVCLAIVAPSPSYNVGRCLYAVFVNSMLEKIARPSVERADHATLYGGGGSQGNTHNKN